MFERSLMVLSPWETDEDGHLLTLYSMLPAGTAASAMDLTGTDAELLDAPPNLCLVEVWCSGEVADAIAADDRFLVLSDEENTDAL